MTNLKFIKDTLNKLRLNPKTTNIEATVIEAVMEILDKAENLSYEIEVQAQDVQNCIDKKVEGLL